MADVDTPGVSAEFTTSPTGTRPPASDDSDGGPPIKPPVQQKNGLEDEIAALLAGTASITEGCKDASKEASRVRRKSKDISASCESMWENAQDRKGAASLWRMLGRRPSKGGDENDLSDATLTTAFAEIDTDKGGTIDKEEMTTAILKMNPAATPEMIEGLWKFADDDGNGEITFEEYCKIMRTM